MENENHQSKYIVIYNDIKHKIVSGIVKPGDKIPSEQDLSIEYGVSRHTVRRALSILQNNGLIDTEQGSGSYCSGRFMNHEKSHNIAVVTTYISDYIFPSLIQGIECVLSKSGYTILLKRTGNCQENERTVLEDILSKNIDGLIIEPSKSEIYCMNESQYAALERRGIPYVFIQGVYPQMLDKPYIMLDDAMGTYKTTKYLLDLGHKHLIGIFKIDDRQGMERFKGYVKSLTDAGITFDPDRVILFHTEDRSIKPSMVLEKMLRDKVQIDGIVCYNDEIALQVYQKIMELGMHVPEDVSITGFDYSGLAVNGPIKLTTATHPKQKLGEMAAELLLEKIDGITENHTKVMRIVHPELVVGESTRRR